MKSTTTWIACLVLGASGTLLSPRAKADCGASMRALSPAQVNQIPMGTPTLAQALVAMPGVQALAAPPQAASGGSIVGLWHITFTSGGQVVDQGFDAWHSDGLEVLNDTPPPATGNVCLGTYTLSKGVFKLLHPSWTFDDTGTLNGTAIIRERVTLDPAGDSFHGTYTLDFFDLSGNNLGHYTGQVTAQRITVD
jgi:hypothetical protein